MRLLIMGPPGAGKGTQSTGIAEHYAIPAISTGDIFRDNIKRETPLGVQVKQLIAAGEYVPDEITNGIVADRLSQPDARRGFLLDGYPRTKPQAAALDALLAEHAERLDAALSLVAEPEALVQRLLKRAQIEGRADDNEEAIRTRLEVYAKETEPLLAHYRERGLLVEVDALGEVGEVAQRIRAALAKVPA